MPGPLAGIKVVEFSQIIAGPFAGMLLADMGADVIKIEPPHGEPWRLNNQFIPLESRTFISLNRGKRSLPLDLTRPEATEIVDRLVADADVVIVNYRPDVSRKLRIDYERLSELNPRLIYCDNTAFGRRGPHSQRPGYDIVAQAITGLMASEGKVVDGVLQYIVSTPIADFATGLAMAWGICAALYVRERTGKGQKIETTLLASALAVQTSRFTWIEAIDAEPYRDFMADLERMRAEGRPFEEIYARYLEFRPRPPGNIYYRTYQTKDGVIAVGCLSDPLRKRLLQVLGLHDIRFDPDYDPQSPEAIEFGKQLTRQAEAIFRQRTTAEWLRILDEAGIPAGPVRFTEELFEDEQVLANNLVVELKHSVVGRIKMVGPVITMSETPLEARSASPALGEHTEEILTALGYSPAQVEELRKKGVTR
jgi:crotonobetainyl-CoA:carnitine CoA-transferase CaiB-like acyl-CoA transferase